MNENVRLGNMVITQLGQNMKTNSSSFCHINFRHTYRELDTLTNSLSKDSLLLQENQSIVEECLY